MGRDLYETTVVLANESNGAVVALREIEVSVYLAGTTDIADIFQGPTGNTKGPAADSGSISGTNPFITGPNGVVEFWLEAGRYDIKFRDTRIPARIPTKTRPISSLPALPDSIPANFIKEDAGLPIESLSPEILRQSIPIGGVIDWWRPNATVPVPTGFSICDGSTVAEANHDFGIAGSITLPNLTNKFIIGASATAEHGAGSVHGNAPENAPGIGGSGGSNERHSHTVPAHGHGNVDLDATDVGHTHPMISYGNGNPGINYPNPVYVTGGVAHTANSDGQGGSGTALKLTNTGAYYGGIAVGSGEANILIEGRVGNDTIDGDAAMTTGVTDGRPLHYGLLKIIKIKRN